MGLLDLFLPDVHERPVFSGTLFECAVMTTPSVLLTIATMLALVQPKHYSIKLLRLVLLLGGLFSILTATTFRNLAIMPEFNVYNYAIGLVGFTMAIKLVEVSFLQTPPKRRKLDKPSKENGTKPRTNGSIYRTPQLTLFALTEEAIRYLYDPRLICYESGPGTERPGFLPPEYRNVNDTRSFLIDTLKTTLLNALAFDFLQTVLKCVPGATFGTPQGGTIFLQYLPPLYRYTLSTAISITTCLCVYFAMNTLHGLATLVSVGLLRQDPAVHPPMFWQPWYATSLRQFWAKGWHSFFNRNFWIMGGLPGKYLAGNAGAVLGAFLISGLLHDVTMWGMGKGRDPLRINGFFLLQGVGIILEEAWRKATGRRVSGRLGNIWAWSFLCATGNIVTEAWLTKGVAGSMYFFSPTSWIVKYVNSLK